MVEWLKRNFALKNIAWVMLILSSAKLVNNMAELARTTSDKVVIPLGQILSEYDNRKRAINNILAVAAMPGMNFDYEADSSDDEEEEEIEEEVETQSQKPSVMENIKKKFGWM